MIWRAARGLSEAKPWGTNRRATLPHRLIPESTLDGIDWAIVGGESGNHLWTDRTCEGRALVEYVDAEWRPRENRKDWVRAIRRRCREKGVAFFFKQWGGATPKAAGRKLDGRTWEQFPDRGSAYLEPAGE